MKKMLAMLTAALFVSAAVAQDAPAKPENNGPRGGRGGMMRGGGMRGGMMPMMRNQRADAEAELAKKAPEEFAALVKERQALEEKMQALAKKNEVKLPDTEFTRAEKIAAFQKKYEKELAEINELRKTDPRGAMRKSMELMQKEGIDFGFGGGMMRGGADAQKTPAPDAGPRENVRAKMEAAIKEKFPEEYDAYLKEKEKDPKAAAQKLRELAKKLGGPKQEKK